MKKITPTYLLTLPGKIDLSPSLSINLDGSNNFDDSPELYFEDMISLIDFVDQLGNDNLVIKKNLNNMYFKDIEIVKERLEDKSSTILNLYFSMFDKDYINQNNWNVFSSIFNLNNLRKESKYVLHSKMHNNNISADNFIASCFKGDQLDNSKVKKLLDEFINNNEALTNIAFTYHCSNSKELLSAIIQRIFEIKNNSVIKRCDNCGKLYIPKKLDTRYCDRISPQYEDKTCKQTMDVIKKNEALNDPIKRLYKNVYNTLYTSFSSNNSKENEKTFKDFIKQNRVKQSKYNKGLITNEEYESWLKSFYKRK